MWGAALVGLTILVYWPTFSNGFIWDDEHYVEWNSNLRSAAGLYNIWFKLGAVPQYYPLVHSAFWVEYHLWRLDPLGYHVVNVLLHATSVLVLWRLLLRLSVPGAWLAAAIFAVHPVHVESVAWITERKNVLSLLLALGSLVAYLRFSPPENNESAHGPWGHYALALVLYVGALLSKTVTASLPAVLLVIYWWKRGQLPWREAIRLVPFFVIGLALASVTAWMEKNVVGAVGAEWSFSALDRALIAGRALCFYASKLFWPHPLVFFYPRWTIDATAWWQYLFPALAAVVVVTLFLARHRLGRGPLAAVLIFAGVLVPALGFFDVYPFRYSFVADHFQYHASTALIALTASALALVASRWTARSWLVAPALAAVLLMALGLVAHRTTHVYKNAATVFEDTIALNPTSWAAHMNLGHILSAEGRHDKAIVHFQAALAIKSNPDRAHTHRSWGDSLRAIGRYNEAMAHYREAARISSPEDLWRAEIGLAATLRGQKRYEEALEHFSEAKRISPEQHVWAVFAGLGECLEEMLRYDEAATAYRRALRLIPDREMWWVRLRLANCLQQQKKYDEAMREIQVARNAAPDDQAWTVHFQAGLCLEAQGRLKAAIGEYRAALAGTDQPMTVQLQLSRALVRAGRGQEGTDQLQAAVDLKLDEAARMVASGELDAAEASLKEVIALGAKTPKAHDLMGVVFGQRGDFAAAIEQFERALAIDPDNQSAKSNLNRARAAVREKEGS
jgi:protein O-mannosyl-transferase